MARDARRTATFAEMRRVMSRTSRVAPPTESECTALRSGWLRDVVRS